MSYPPIVLFDFDGVIITQKALEYTASFFLKFRRMYPKYEKYETLKPNLEEVLIKFKKSEFLLGIVSNTNKRRLDSFKQKLNLGKYFSVFVSRDDTLYRKPHPYPIITALKQFKILKIKHIQCKIGFNPIRIF
ncbi:Phosphoglycolate phosphatase [subsurface metagenome]